MDLKESIEQGIKLLTIQTLNEMARDEIRCHVTQRTVPCITGYPQYFQLLDQHSRIDIEDKVMRAKFDGTEPYNNPHGEHDFGAFELADIPFHWTIDYYDNQLLYPSLDPSDISQTIRFLTIRLGFACCRKHPKCKC